MARRTTEQIAQLESLKTQFGAGRSAAKRSALNHLAGSRISTARDLYAYHEVLCFLRAFPDDSEVMGAASAELSRFEVRVGHLRAEYGGALPESLVDSGIAGTPYRYPFSYPMATWLAERFPSRVEIDWALYAEREEDSLGRILTPLASWAETTALDDEGLSAEEWFTRTAPAGRTALARLIVALRRSGLPLDVQESLYDFQNLDLRWDLTGHDGSRTLARIDEPSPFFHCAAFRGRTDDLLAEVSTPMSRARPVARKRAQRLRDLARCSLSVRARELYPLALSHDKEVYDAPVGRGVRIVLFGLEPGRRLPIESDYGAFVLKNGMPIGYGVVALLLDRMEIAVNIFPTFRQGESSFVFEQFVRLVRHHFGAKVLLVERYQLGHENDEGLEAGSFWFYYKLGLRPCDPAVARLAEAEAERLTRTPGARTPRALLRRLARADVTLDLSGDGPGAGQRIRLTRIGMKVTERIEREFGGDRKRAEEHLGRALVRRLGVRDWATWTDSERTALRRLAPLVSLFPDLDGWTQGEKAFLARVLRAKGADEEATYARMVGRFASLHLALLTLSG